MKTFQKFELLFGIATLATALVLFSVIIFFGVTQSANNSFGEELATGFWIFVFPSSLVAIGSYFYAIKRSNAGLYLLLISGGIFVCFFAFVFLIVFLAGAIITMNNLFALAPSLFAALTIAFATLQTKWFSSKQNNLS